MATTYSSDEQSLSGVTREKEPTSVLPSDLNVENGEVDKDHHAGEAVDPPSPRKVHGISVCRGCFHFLVLDADTFGYLSGYLLWLAHCLPFYSMLLTIPSWPILYR